MRMYIDDDSPLGKFLLQLAPGRARTCALYDLYSREEALGRQRSILNELAAKMDQLDAQLNRLLESGGQRLKPLDSEDQAQGKIDHGECQDGATSAKLRKMVADFEATLQ